MQIQTPPNNLNLSQLIGKLLGKRCLKIFNCVNVSYFLLEYCEILIGESLAECEGTILNLPKKNLHRHVCNHQATKYKMVAIGIKPTEKLVVFDDILTGSSDRGGRGRGGG